MSVVTGMWIFHHLMSLKYFPRAAFSALVHLIFSAILYRYNSIYFWDVIWEVH